MKLTLGFSPCPNDCFIFDALVHNKIDTQGIQFEVVMEDVEALNKKAFASELDITKLSYHTFFYLADRYALLNSGSALGFGCGPLLVSRNDVSLKSMPVNEWRVAIPGKYTTANFLLSLAYPDIQFKTEMIFSDIETSVINGNVDAGLLIHENRFTFEQKGLKKILDLGEFWEGMISAPIPLGGIVMKRNFAVNQVRMVDELIRKSVEFAFAHPDSCMDFVKQHAQEMDEEVMRKHIDLYVNRFSVDLGDLGWRAIQLMFQMGMEKHVIPATVNNNIPLGVQ